MLPFSLSLSRRIIYETRGRVGEVHREAHTHTQIDTQCSKRARGFTELYIQLYKQTQAKVEFAQIRLTQLQPLSVWLPQYTRRLLHYYYPYFSPFDSLPLCVSWIRTSDCFSCFLPLSHSNNFSFSTPVVCTEADSLRRISETHTHTHTHIHTGTHTQLDISWLYSGDLHTGCKVTLGVFCYPTKSRRATRRDAFPFASSILYSISLSLSLSLLV